MDKLRLRFSKTGRAVYISHLDQMHTIQRAFSRAGYELKYSEGFNPHPQLSVALPMSLGTASLCEILDFKLKEDTDISVLPEKLSAALPEGLAVTECYYPQRAIKELKYLRVEARLEYDDRPISAMSEGVDTFYHRPEIVITKRTKRGQSETDLMGCLRSVEVSSGEDGVILSAVISAQEPAVNPALLIDALRQLEPGLTPDFSSFIRLETYDKNMERFR